jgi:hypothetical protein
MGKESKLTTNDIILVFLRKRRFENGLLSQNG